MGRRGLCNLWHCSQYSIESFYHKGYTKHTQLNKRCDYIRYILAIAQFSHLDPLIKTFTNTILPKKQLYGHSQFNAQLTPEKMKKSTLKACNVHEMNVAEMQTYHGGAVLIPLVLFGVLGAYLSAKTVLIVKSIYSSLK